MTVTAHPTSAMQKKTPSDRLLYLDALRGMAIIFVVWLHASSYSHHEITEPTALFVLRFINPGVAFFFLADGFLFARHMSRYQEFEYVDYMRKSAWRLLLPWLIFTASYGMLRAGFESAGFFTTYLLIGHSFTEILGSLFNSSFAMQMYFLMSLFLIRALSPVTRHLAIHGWHVAMSSTVVYILLLNSSNFKLGADPVTSSIAGFQYYLLGILYFHLDDGFRRRALPIAGVCLLGYGIMVALEVWGFLPESAEMLAKLAAMTANYALYLILVQRAGLLVRLGQHTMEIYLLHAPVFVFGAALVASRVVADPLGLHLVVAVASLLGSLAVGWLISRIPRGRIVFGESASVG